MIKILSLISLFLFVNFQLRADIVEVLEKMNSNYSSDKTYRVETNYKMFKGHDSGNLVEEYNGFTENSKLGFFQKINHSEKILTKDFYLHVSHPEKAIVYGLPFKSEFNKSIQEVLKYCSTSSIELKGKEYVLIFEFNNFTDFEFSKIKMVISKDKYLLKSIDLYYSILTDFSNEFSKKDDAQSHVKMSFTKYRNSVELDKSYFLLKNYIDFDNKLSLKTTGRSRDYELIDIRTQL